MLPSRARLAAAMRVLGFNLALLAVLFVILEAFAVWYAGRHRTGWLFQIDPVTGHAHVPEDFALSASTADSIGSSRHFTLKRYPAEPDLAPLRIVTLGGSTTDPLGDQFSGQNGTWPDHLGALAEARGEAVEIANAGVGGFSSAQELLKLLSVTAFHTADLVIALNGINEIYVEQNRLYADDDNLMASDVFLKNVHRGRRPVIDYNGRTFVPCAFGVCINSRLWQALESGIDQVLSGFKRRDLPSAEAVLLDPDTLARLDRAADQWSRNVDSAHAVAAVNGAGYLVVLQPTMGLDRSRPEIAAAIEQAPADDPLRVFADDLLGTAYVERIGALYGRLRERCAARPFCVDLSRPEHLPSTAEFYTDPRHPNSKGNARIAALIADHLDAIGAW
jgi:lysophospholipase L1-like esterase